jgi:hypothetical protein
MNTDTTATAVYPWLLGRTLQERYIAEILYHGSANCRSIVLLQQYFLPATGSGIAPMYNARQPDGSSNTIGTAIDDCIYALIHQYLCNPESGKPELLGLLETSYKTNPRFRRPLTKSGTYTFNRQTIDAFTRAFKENSFTLGYLFNQCFQER